MPRKKLTRESKAPPLAFQKQEILRCGRDPIYFINTYVYIQHPKKGKLLFKTFDYQDDVVRNFEGDKNVITNKSRQLGLSTVCAAYALWLALFRRDKNILVIATKLGIAQNFMKKVFYAYDELPTWLVMARDVKRTKTELGLSSGSTVKAIPTSPDAGRSEALTLLIVDECAHIADMDEIWVGLQPTLSCVTGDTLVLTDNGFKRIDSFHQDRQIGDYFDLEIPVYGKNGMEKTSKGYVSPNNKTIIVQTNHGHKVEVTPIHPLYTLQNTGVGKMIQAQDLRLDSYLRIEVGQNVFGKEELEPDVAYMLGGYIAEGWIAKRKNMVGEWKYDSIEVENTDSEFRNVYLSNSLVKPFSIVPSRTTRLRCSSRELVNKWIKYGIDPHAYCYNKQTPKAILEGTRNTVTNYLSGLFDGDGSVTTNGIVYSTTSEKLARETSLLLHNLGFVTNIHHVHPRTNEIGRIMPQGKPLQSLRDSWRVIIMRSQFDKFANEIGFRIDRKQKLLSELGIKFDQNSRKLFTVPASLVETPLRSLLERSGKLQSWFREHHNIRFDKALSKDNHKRVVTQEWLLKTKEAFSDLFTLTETDLEFYAETIGSFYWDKIHSLTESHNKTYDFTVPETHTFLQNGILGSNTGGKAILISSPNGVGNTFHRIWVDAVEGKNDFVPIELPWTVHPERDQEWYDRESANIRAGKGERGVQQEFWCSFNASGDTFAKTEILNIIEQGVRDPIAKHPDYPDCWIWKYAQPDHKYLIAADVSRGNAADYSTFHVFDTTSDEIVCEFKSKVYPDVLADILADVGRRYNTALICPELNTYGAHTANDLKKKGYPNLYYEKVHKNIYMAYMDTQSMGADELPGWTSGPKSRDEAIAKLEAVLRNQVIRLPSKRLLNELKTFIWKNNKAQAMKGYNDDLVMALAIGVTLYETSGRPQYSQEELAASLIAGMSVNTSKMGVSLGDWGVREQQTQSPFFAGSRGTASSTPNKFLPSQQPVAPKSGNNNTQNFNNPYWAQWAWVTKD
jgi:intein/homing endonuclease